MTRHLLALLLVWLLPLGLGAFLATVGHVFLLPGLERVGGVLVLVWCAWCSLACAALGWAAMRGEG
jgi:hypothetical protein